MYKIGLSALSLDPSTYSNVKDLRLNGSMCMQGYFLVESKDYQRVTVWKVNQNELVECVFTSKNDFNRLL